jgi:hypothetical protein
MKKIILIISCFICLSAFSDSTVEVISTEFPLEDQLGRNSLCLLIVRIPSSGALLGVVEDITDCFYARAAKRAPHHKIKLPLKKLSKIQDKGLREHLQRIDTELEFYFLDGD